MTKWKLCRQSFGSEEFTLSEGEEISVGRAMSNTITLSSIVISRNHCVLNVFQNKVVITDLMSSNGVYVGLERIPQNQPYDLKDSDTVGIGWTIGAPLANISDNEKFVFTLCKESVPSLLNRIQFQDDLEENLAALDGGKTISPQPESPILCTKLSLKRKADKITQIKSEIKEEKKCRIVTIDDDVVNLLSDSDNEIQKKLVETNLIKKKSICEESNKTAITNQIKCENDFMEYEAFNVKQEYLGYDDEPIKVDSDSDSESEQWYLRLSQSSPGKPFLKIPQEKTDVKQEDSSYSQMDDDYVSFVENEEEYMDDLISIPPQPPDESSEPAKLKSDEEDFEDIISLDQPHRLTLPSADPIIDKDDAKDEVDGSKLIHGSKEIDGSTTLPVVESQPTAMKKTQMIEPRVHESKTKTKHHHNESEKKSKRSSSNHSKIKKHSSKRHITNSQKEERKKKLKEIATKEREHEKDTKDKHSSSKSTTSVKVTSSNRGTFLTDSVLVVKPVKRTDDIKESKTKHNSSKSTPKSQDENTTKDKGPIDHSSVDVENKNKTDSSSKDDNKSKHKHKSKHDSSKTKTSHNKSHESSKTQEVRVPLKSLKPLTESETYSGKPFSKVEPLPPAVPNIKPLAPTLSKIKTISKDLLPTIAQLDKLASSKIQLLPVIKAKKTVRFSDAGPEIHIFEIEPGNQMKKTGLVKTSIIDTRKRPVFSLEKISLMKILRWNPHWLEEQINNNDPPPILGHSNPPMNTFHSYASHRQYVATIGDLLLIEIWECLSMAYMKVRNQNNGFQMRIGALPAAPSQDRCYELFNLSVNISLPNNGPKNVPRVGEVILATFGPENAKTQRFFYVHNVRTLPSPPNNIHSFYSVSLHATFTEKMRSLRQGEMIVGMSLAYINKELNLFEAMEYLAGSPLSEAILRPEPWHFQTKVPANDIKSQWTKTLNRSQQTAVTCSVAAALGDRPSIQMVQGPPGTGKSSVICAMVMTYFYDEQGKRQQNRGKILICATSNAAVDELVIRLLNIRQNLPKTERFRMVRVGRAEAMHARARDVSSLNLAQRDAARLHTDQPPPPLALREEISHLEAKINMWKTQAQNAKDPSRVAYCQGRTNELVKRITQVRAGGGAAGEELRPEQLVAAERRIIEGADIVVTTLASAHNYKMKGLKRRIALCIIDEAGQAIEPETLIPLTLDVTRLTLIGDPQQLPGFICSQRAKQHGLGESLFSRLTSSTEQWDTNPVVLLNQQYRMHPDIADYPNRAFYGGLVQTCAPPRPPGLAVPPYAIVSISSGDKGQGYSGANELEAWGVSRLVTALNATLRARDLNLAVITPYNAHKELIKKYLKTLQYPAEPPIEVNTVDSFQGQERDVVVVSLARSQGIGFLTDPGRMNVMLTRAKHALLIALNPHAMLKNHQWRTLVEDAQRRNMYKVLPNKMCQPLAAGQAQQDDILKYIVVSK